MYFALLWKKLRQSQSIICSCFPSECNEITNVTDLFLIPQENETWTPVDCLVGLQWCQSANSCQPLGSCCHQEPCANSTTRAASGVPHPCKNKSWSVALKTSHFTLPLGPSTRYLVSVESLSELMRYQGLFCRYQTT